MKKYKLKEEVKKYIKKVFWDRVETKLWWNENTLLTIESDYALEEVPQRVKLQRCYQDEEDRKQARKQDRKQNKWIDKNMKEFLRKLIMHNSICN